MAKGESVTSMGSRQDEDVVDVPWTTLTSSAGDEDKDQDDERKEQDGTVTTPTPAPAPAQASGARVPTASQSQTPGHSASDGSRSSRRRVTPPRNINNSKKRWAVDVDVDVDDDIDDDIDVHADIEEQAPSTQPPSPKRARRSSSSIGRGTERGRGRGGEQGDERQARAGDSPVGWQPQDDVDVGDPPEEAAAPKGSSPPDAISSAAWMPPGMSSTMPSTGRKRTRRQTAAAAAADADGACGVEDGARLRCSDNQKAEEWRVFTTVGGTGMDEGKERGGGRARARARARAQGQERKAAAQSQHQEGLEALGAEDPSPSALAEAEAFAQASAEAFASEETEKGQVKGKGAARRGKGKGKGKGTGRGKVRGKAKETGTETEKGTGAGAGKGEGKAKGRGKSRRKSCDENMSDSYSDNSDGGGRGYRHGASDSPIRRRPRSTRNQSRTPLATYPPPTPSTLDEPLLVIDSDDDDDIKAMPAAQGCADHPSRAAPMTMVTLSDEEGSRSNGVRDTSFVATKFGDGVVEVRGRTERRVAPPGTQKVRLSWATAYLPEEEIRPVPHETRIVYPNKETTGAVRVTRADVLRLEENIFLNDTIIDFYLRYLLSRPDSLGGELKPSQVHAFSPLVVQGITNVSDRDAADPSAYWRKVQKWTKGLDLFDKKIVLFPINSALHWSLLVLVNPDCFEDRVKDIPLKKASAGTRTSASTSADASTDAAGDSSLKSTGEGGDGDGDGDDDPKSESGSESGSESESGRSADGAGGLGSTAFHPEGEEWLMQHEGSDAGDADTLSALGKPPAEEGERSHASDDIDGTNDPQNGDTRAVSRLAAQAATLSPGSGCSEQDPAPRGPGGMVWPPAPATQEIRQHKTLFFGLGLGGCSSSGRTATAASVSAAGGGSPSRDAPKSTLAGAGSGGGSGSSDSAMVDWRLPRSRPSVQGLGTVAMERGEPQLQLQPEREREADRERGSAEGSPLPLPLPLPSAMEVEVETEAEEDPLPSRAGEIVGGGKTRQTGRAPSPPPPAATMACGASSGASGGSPAGSAPSDAVDAKDLSGVSCESSWRRPVPEFREGGTDAETTRPGRGSDSGSSQAAAPLFPGGEPQSDMENTVAPGRAIRRRKKAHPSQSHGCGKQARRALGGEDDDEEGKEEDARGRARDSDEVAGSCSLLLLFGKGNSNNHGRASSSGLSSSSRRKPAGRRSVVAPTGVETVDMVNVVDAVPTRPKDAGGREEEASGRMDASGGGVGRPNDANGDSARGGASAEEWRVNPDGKAAKQQRVSGDRDGSLPARYSLPTTSGSLRAASHDSGSSAAEATHAVAEALMSGQGRGWVEDEDKRTQDVAKSAERASVRAHADASILAGRTRSRLRSASCDGKRDRTSQQPPTSAAAPAAAAPAAAAPAAAGAPATATGLASSGVDTSASAGASAGMVATTASGVDERVMRESGGGGEVADSTAGGGDPLPIPRRSSSDGSLNRKAGGEGEGEAGGVGAVDDKNPIPCMLLLDSTKGHRSQEMFRMVRKYVEAAWNNTHGAGSKVDVTAKVLGGCSPPIPQQTNDCDCGVYVIHYAKLILQTPPTMTQRFLEKKGRGGMFSTRWFDKRVISDTRKTIRNTIEGLRWDRMQQERASTANSTNNTAGASGKAKAASRRKA